MSERRVASETAKSELELAKHKAVCGKGAGYLPALRTRSRDRSSRTHADRVELRQWQWLWVSFPPTCPHTHRHRIQHLTS